MPPKLASSLASGPSGAVSGYLYKHRWVIAVFLAALAVRLHWNLVVHPLGDYIYSDMNGYVQRANRLLKDPFKVYEYHAFFPFLTHWLVAGFLKVFGKENYQALGAGYAFIGALGVAYAYTIAARISYVPKYVAPAVGLVAIWYYPHFSLGGYILSEIPFCTCMMGALHHGVKLYDHGRYRNAFMMGAFCSIGMLFRPQMLISAAFIGLLWIARRKAMPNIKFKHLAVSAIPVLLLLGGASYHLNHHTGRYGLISENASFNLVFGRCHNSKIESLPDGKHGKVHFRPPPLLQVNNQLKRKDGKEPDILLDPILGDVLSYRGYIGDTSVHKEFLKECWHKTGVLKQLSYTSTNVQLLWRWNIPWPDSGRATWRPPARWWTYQHRLWLAIPGLLGLLFIFWPGQRNAKRALVSVNLLAVLFLAALFFGGARHRAPYDLVIMILAFEVWAIFLRIAGRFVSSVALDVQSAETAASVDSGGKSAHINSSS